MTEAEISELFARVEAKFDLFEPTVDGWSAWQLLRFPVAAQLAREAPGSPGGVPSRARAELVASGLADWARYSRLTRAQVLAKSYASALAEVGGDGRYRDVFFDDILDVVGPSVKIEVQNAPARRDVHRPARATTRGIDLAARLVGRVAKSKDISEVAHHLGDVITSELGASGFDPLIVERRLLGFRGARRAYGRLLARVRPRVVLVADTGEFELFAAAKERDVRCVELQHGIFTRHHADALGATAVGHRERLIVPDALLLFGSYWEDDLRAGGFYGDELRVVGSPRVDRFRALREDVHRPDGACRILVTSQGIAPDELAQFLAETMALARAERFDCRLDVKLHPIYDASSRATYESALHGGDVRILSSDDPPSTLELLSAADAHASISSACHFESLGIGVPTIVLALPGHEQVMPLVDAGDAALAPTPAELLRHLRESSDLRVPEEVSGRYYRPGALERIASEVGPPSKARSRP